MSKIVENQELKTDLSGRDSKGRWLKGHCPNPNGNHRGDKSQAIRAFLYEHKDELLQASLKAALEGDS